MTTYYNENDEYAVEWLRNLIFAGLIADGEVDSRSIEDVRPADLRGFTQCHFFAGIGVWSHSLRLAGWPDDRPVWTGSCPCQPFSSAGKGAGLGDERHLWPAWFHLIDQCRPPDLLGEQVASKGAMPWLDLVQTDLEILGYTFGAVPFPAAGVGAFHIRDRLYWVAHDGRKGRGQERANAGWRDQRGVTEGVVVERLVHGGALGEPGRLAHSGSTRLEGRDQGAMGHECAALERGGCACGLADPHLAQPGLAGRPVSASGAGVQRGAGLDDSGAPRATYWSDADWIPCRDGKWRPVEPGTFPLAHGATRRVGRLRAYGNAIVAQAAQAWIEVVMECMP